MRSAWARQVARNRLARALREAGAARIPVYRIPRDENGVPAGGARHIGCLLGAAYERGQTANLAIDIPGVIARRDMKRALCVMGWGCAADVQRGDLLLIGGAWFEALDALPGMGIALDIILSEAVKPDGV